MVQEEVPGPDPVTQDFLEDVRFVLVEVPHKIPVPLILRPSPDTLSVTDVEQGRGPWVVTRHDLG